MFSFESPVRTPWHRVPVAWKFTGLCVVSFFLFMQDNWQIQVAALVVVTSLYLLGGLKFLQAGVKRLRFLWPFLLVIAVWHVATHSMLEGLSIALRLVTIMALSNLMTMTSRLADMLDWLRKLMKPLRMLGINTRPIELAIALVVRFTPILIGKASVIADAWRMRSIKRPGFRIVFPLSLAAIDDAEYVAEALRARGGALAPQHTTQWHAEPASEIDKS